ncbi:MAG: AmmeMemoRadiSam system protein A [Ignavibacteriae bacterium]|nr:AmmeMemoRadiSam system protein A [Ignavibacteriota bacterium]
MPYTEDERNELLKLARTSIQAVLENNPVPEVSSASPAFNEPRGVFVTLRMGGELRGCIGYIEPKHALAAAVQEIAQKAAFEDPRFPMLTKDELTVAEIEVSVLMPIERVNDVAEIEIGKHGLVVEFGGSRGLLLPHVATAYKWDREQFLRQASVKAGLPPEAWKSPGVTIYKFSTETFSDHVHSHHSS